MSVDKNASYYDAGGIETIEVIRAKLTTNQFVGYLLGNIIKYASRANHKGCIISDLNKLITYSSILAKELEWIDLDDDEVFLP